MKKNIILCTIASLCMLSCRGMKKTPRPTLTIKNNTATQVWVSVQKKAPTSIESQGVRSFPVKKRSQMDNIQIEFGYTKENLQSQDKIIGTGAIISRNPKTNTLSIRSGTISNEDIELYQQEKLKKEKRLKIAEEKLKKFNILWQQKKGKSDIFGELGRTVVKNIPKFVPGIEIKRAFITAKRNKPKVVRSTPGPRPEEESSFIFKKLQGIHKAQQSFLGLQKFKQSETLKVCITGSGGGARSMMSSTGFTCGAQEIGLLPCVSYFAALSGSTWFLAPWLYSGMDVRDYRKHVLNIIVKSYIDIIKENFSDIILDPLIYYTVRNQPTTFINNWGRLLSHYLRLADLWKKQNSGQKPNLQNITMSDLERNVRHENKVVPLLEARVMIPKENKKEAKVCTFTPWEFGSRFFTKDQNIGAYIPIKSFGSKFNKCTEKTILPPLSLGFLMGICGSAPAAYISQFLKSDSVSFGVTQEDEAQIAGWKGKRPIKAYIHNCMQRCKRVLSSIQSKPYLDLLDSGIKINTPFIPLYRFYEKNKGSDKDDRQAPPDVIFVFDGSDNIGNAFKASEKELALHSLPFPQLPPLTSKQESLPTIVNLVQKSGMAIFEPRFSNYRAPVVIYLPLVQANGPQRFAFNVNDFPTLKLTSYTRKQGNDFMQMVENNITSEENVKRIKHTMQKRIILHKKIRESLHSLMETPSKDETRRKNILGKLQPIFTQIIRNIFMKIKANTDKIALIQNITNKISKELSELEPKDEQKKFKLFWQKIINEKITLQAEEKIKDDLIKQTINKIKQTTSDMEQNLQSIITEIWYHLIGTIPDDKKRFEAIQKIAEAIAKKLNKPTIIQTIKNMLPQINKKIKQRINKEEIANIAKSILQNRTIQLKNIYNTEKQDQQIRKLNPIINQIETKLKRKIKDTSRKQEIKKVIITEIVKNFKALGQNKEEKIRLNNFWLQQIQQFLKAPTLESEEEEEIEPKPKKKKKKSGRLSYKDLQKIQERKKHKQEEIREKKKRRRKRTTRFISKKKIKKMQEITKKIQKEDEPLKEKNISKLQQEKAKYLQRFKEVTKDFENLQNDLKILKEKHTLQQITNLLNQIKEYKKFKLKKISRLNFAQTTGLQSKINSLQQTTNEMNSKLLHYKNEYRNILYKISTLTQKKSKRSEKYNLIRRRSKLKRPKSEEEEEEETEGEGDD